MARLSDRAALLLALSLVASVALVAIRIHSAGGGRVEMLAAATKQKAVMASLPVASVQSMAMLPASTAVVPEVVYYVPVVQQAAAFLPKQQILAAAASSPAAASPAAASPAAAAPAAAAAPQAPQVEDMNRAAIEVQHARDARRLRDNDIDYEQHQPKDHHYYAGPATSRQIPTTDIRGQSTVANPVSTIPYPASGSAIATQNAIYSPELPEDKHDVHDDITEAAIDHPTREMVARALEHIQSKEIGTEYFHDTLVDNDPSSYHYQQSIHVDHVVGSRNADNSLLAWNGIGGIFGPGAVLGPEDDRNDVKLHAKVFPSGELKWHGEDHLDTERILQAGTSFTDNVEFGGDTRDLAEQVLRNSVPDLSIQPNKFISYDPAHPPVKQRNSYIHTWAAYTPEGSERRIEAAKGQEAFQEWQETHKKQAWLAVHGVPCFDGKVPCKKPRSTGHAATGGGGGGGSGGNGAQGEVVAK